MIINSYSSIDAAGVLSAVPLPSAGGDHQPISAVLRVCVCLVRAAWVCDDQRIQRCRDSTLGLTIMIMWVSYYIGLLVSIWSERLMMKKQQKFSRGLSDKVRKSKAAPEIQNNPFEVKINRKKFDVLGRKSKHDVGLPGVSRSKANKKVKHGNVCVCARLLWYYHGIHCYMMKSHSFGSHLILKVSLLQCNYTFKYWVILIN